MIFLWIALAGAAGALTRYGFSGLVHTMSGSRLPWGTLVVNLLACFLLGLLAEVSGRSGWLSPEARMGLTGVSVHTPVLFTVIPFSAFPRIFPSL